MAEQKNPQAQENVSSQNINELIRVRREKLAALQEAGKDPFTITKYNQTHHTDEVKSLYNDHEAKLLAGRVRPSTEGLDEQQAKDVINEDYNERRAIMDADPIEVSIAGRMMFKRVMGKASFCNIADLKGNIQVYVAKDAVGEEAYADFKKSDIGDIYGVKGYVFRTKNGRPLDRSNICHDMKKLCRVARVNPEKVFPHNLRHLFARTFYSMDKDIVRLADLLGHSNVNTTRIYTMETGNEHRHRLERVENLLMT